MKPIATALRRLADRLDPRYQGCWECYRRAQGSAPINALGVHSEERRGHVLRSNAPAPTVYTGRPRGIPAADRGDALDFEWDEPHGENPW